LLVPQSTSDLLVSWHYMCVFIKG